MLDIIKFRPSRARGNRWLRVAVTACILMIGHRLPAAEVQVSPDGDDAKPGGAAQPFKTIGRASRVLRAGDRCMISGGIYRETVVLTVEACLIICDQWTAGTSKPKWTAGQLWQFYAMKEQGKDWFCSEDDGAFNVPHGQGKSKPVTRQMLVKFSSDAGTETFVEQVNQSYLAPNPKKRPQDKFFTTGSKRTVSVGAESSFTLVVVPHEPSQSAKSIAEGISFNEKADGVEVTIGRSAQVTMHRDGSWEIVRKP